MVIFYVLSSFFLFSCSTTVRLSSEEQLEIKNKALKVTVYGYDRRMADVSADIIHVQEYNIASIPSSIQLNIPPNPYRKINHLENNSDAQFYLLISWDSNGDGEARSKGDIDFDWDIKFPNIKLGRRQTLTLKTIRQFTLNTNTI